MSEPEPPHDGFDTAVSAVFRKTLSETDLVLFAGLSGDLHPVHIDQESQAARDAGGRTIHAVFLVALMSTAVSRLMQRAALSSSVRGFRSLRFHGPARPGDTVTAAARIAGPGPGGVLDVQISATTEAGQLLADGIAEVELR